MKANDTKEGIKQARGSGQPQSISLRVVQKSRSGRSRGGDSRIWIRDGMTVHAASSQTSDGEGKTAGGGIRHLCIVSPYILLHTTHTMRKHARFQLIKWLSGLETRGPPSTPAPSKEESLQVAVNARS